VSFEWKKQLHFGIKEVTSSVARVRVLTVSLVSRMNLEQIKPHDRKTFDSYKSSSCLSLLL
jgi:hypothetical protein